MAAPKLPGERVLFGLLPGPDGYLFRCPVCDACTSTEVDTPCSPYCRALANKRRKPASRRRGGAEGGEG